MVGAQKAIKIASSFLPWRNIISDTIIMENTTRSIIKFMIPIFWINLLIMFSLVFSLKIDIYSELSYSFLSFLLTFSTKCTIATFKKGSYTYFNVLFLGKYFSYRMLQTASALAFHYS